MGKKEFAFTIYSEKAKKVHKYWFRNRAEKQIIKYKI